jgi:hypothetical protein
MIRNNPTTHPPEDEGNAGRPRVRMTKLFPLRLTCGPKRNAPYSNVYADQKTLDSQGMIQKLTTQNLHVTSFIAWRAQYGSR